MKKTIAAGAILAAVGVLSLTAFAGERQWDEANISTVKVSPTVVKSSVLSMHIENANAITSNLGPNQLLFSIKINASADAKIAMGSPGVFGKSKLRAGGLVMTQGAENNGYSLTGIIDEEYRDALESDPAYFFTGVARLDDRAEVLLLEGQDQYTINVATTDKQSVDDYIMPGTYTFDFLAQAYTE